MNELLSKITRLFWFSDKKIAEDDVARDYAGQLKRNEYKRVTVSILPEIRSYLNDLSNLPRHLE